MSFSCHEPNVLLIAHTKTHTHTHTHTQIMLLLVNYQLIPFPVRPKSSLIEESSRESSQTCHNFTVLSSFLTSKNKDPKWILQTTTNPVLVLKFIWTLKFVFPW